MQLMTVGCIDGRIPVDSRSLSPPTTAFPLPFFRRFTVFSSGEEEEEDDNDVVVDDDSCDSSGTDDMAIAVSTMLGCRCLSADEKEKASDCIMSIIAIVVTVMIIMAALLLTLMVDVDCCLTHSGQSLTGPKAQSPFRPFFYLFLFFSFGLQIWFLAP
jgi:hypothetical protein